MRPFILVVDDYESVRTTLDFILSNMGYAVLPAANGRAALELAGTHPIRAALVDVNMPELDGYAVCRALKAAHPTLPVWLMTAVLHCDVPRLAREAGALDVFTKPFDEPRLIAALQAEIPLNDNPSPCPPASPFSSSPLA